MRTRARVRCAWCARCAWFAWCVRACLRLTISVVAGPSKVSLLISLRLGRSARALAVSTPMACTRTSEEQRRAT
eukprot:1525795-Pleurochrysis_carterae.AAC.1